MKRMAGLVVAMVAALLPADAPGASEPGRNYDIVVYGGTSAGVAAAVQVKRLGKTVVLIEPTRRLGGLTTGGLGQTDIGNKAAIGGIAREFYQRVRKHYDEPAAWKWQTAAQYADSGQTRTAKSETAMWTFEPSAALKIVNDMVREAGVDVIYGERLDRKKGVTKNGPRIVADHDGIGRVFRGRIFLDATYEGDLMAAAGVSYTVGREANSKYGETLNGVQTKQAVPTSSSPASIPTSSKATPRAGCCPSSTPAGPGRRAKATAACRPTASACA